MCSVGLRYATLKKWLIAFTASAVLIGCGGGSGVGNLTSGGGGTTGGRGIPTVVLGNTAQVQVLFLSGAGRRGPQDSQVADIDNVRVYNSPTDYQPTDLQGSGSPLKIGLDNYTLNQFVFDVALKTGGPSKTFTKFPLAIKAIEDKDGNLLFSGPFEPTPFFDMNLTLFPGRQTTIQVLLNDLTIHWDTTNNVLVWDRSVFETENYSVTNNKLNGFLSDMISFDVSAVPIADRPLDSKGEVVDMVHFSGDSIAMSGPFKMVGLQPQATFDVLNPVVIDSGVMRKPQIIGGKPVPGIYNVMEPDPRDPFGNAKITAIQGIYRPYTDFLTNMPDFSMVALPTTRNSTVNQVVLFNRNAAGTITAMWQGIIDYNKPTTGVIRLFNLKDLPNAAATPRASGTVKFTKQGGVVKQGSFAITSVPPGYPFPATGEFVVLR